MQVVPENLNLWSFRAFEARQRSYNKQTVCQSLQNPENMEGSGFFISNRRLFALRYWCLQTGRLVVGLWKLYKHRKYFSSHAMNQLQHFSAENAKHCQYTRPFFLDLSTRLVILFYKCKNWPIQAITALYYWEKWWVNLGKVLCIFCSPDNLKQQNWISLSNGWVGIKTDSSGTFFFNFNSSGIRNAFLVQSTTRVPIYVHYSCLRHSNSLILALFPSLQS